MSSDFSKKLVYDDRLMVSDSVDYAVIKGGSQVTQASFAAISQSTSSVTFNISVPSEQTLIDRRVLWTASAVIRVVGTPTNGSYLLNYGSDTALGPFPLHNLCSVMSATINNNTVSTNIQDVLPALLRCNDSRELAAYNGMTPTMFDTYQSYTDAVNSSNNPLSSFNNTNDNDMLPRGATNVVVTGNSISTADGQVKTVDIAFTVTEPLLLSPFIWADPKSNNQAFYGVQNMNFQFNLAPLTGVVNRVLRSVNAAAQNITNVSLFSFEKNQLLFTFITPPPSLLMPARNVVPYYEVPRYITGFTSEGANTAGVIIPATLQLNQVPDKLIIMIRKRLGAQRINDPDFCLPITNVSINWNNSSGILSSATPQELYRYSRDAGSNQNWQEFSGKTFKNVAPVANVQNGVTSNINTSGSFLMLDFGKAIQISDDWYAPGSLGSFNLQIKLSYLNTTAAALDAEVVIITLNSGVFVNERGSSSTYTGILTKQDVLDAAGQEPVSHASVKRLVGGGFLDTLKSVVGKVAPIAKIGLALAPHPAAKAASAALGALGYGKSGGRKHNKLM
jgi:hypothetical protein